MPSRLRIVIIVGAMLAAFSPGLEPSVEAAPSITLSPDSGDAPSESGSISGSGWECSPGVAPVGSASVSGRGVSGAAYINRDGTLGGNFDVTGDPGQSVTVTVQADEACPSIGPPIYLQASAPFTFDEPPPEPTPTRAPTRTPAPSATAPPPPTSTAPSAPTNTPPPPAVASATPQPARTTPTQPPSRSPEPGTRTPPPVASATPSSRSEGRALTLAGCVPEGPITLEFVPLGILNVEGTLGDPSGPPVTLPAVQSPELPGLMSFDPPASDPGRVFRVTPRFDDPACVIDDGGAGIHWIDGQDLVVPLAVPGNTKLHVCAVGDKTPCEFPVVKGAYITRDGGSAPAGTGAAIASDAWVTEKNYFAEDLKKAPFRFRSSTEAAATSARLQASVWPFPASAEQDPMSPPGLVASWDIACVNCEFTVDLSQLAPEEPPKKKSWAKKSWDVATKPVTYTAKGVWGAITWVGDVVGLGDGDDGPDAIEASGATVDTSLPGKYVVNAPASIPLPTTFYFRIVPLNDNTAVAAPPSNNVKLQRIDKPPDVKIVSTPTPVVTESPYTVDIVSYHGILPPIVSNKICYIATQDAWPADFWGLTYTTNAADAVSSGAKPVKKGQPICQPEPKEPSILEAIVAWAEDAVNWASEAWDDLKGFAVDVILEFTPLGLSCGLAESAGAIPGGTCAAAFAVALDAALVALGIPPDIPNFDELVDQGVGYLAAEIAAQVAIPPDVVKAAIAEGGPYAGFALDAAEAKLREELQQEIEANLQDAALKVQIGNSKAVAWVPDGIPVRKDDYLPPAMTVRVTRKQGVPGGDAGCSFNVSDGLHLDQSAINNPPPGYASFVQGLPHPLSSLTTYDLFVDEAGLGYDKNLFVPPLDPGESTLIPMTFKPNYYKSGWSPSGLIATSDYIAVWRYLHDFGKVRLSATGTCGADTLEVPAAAALLAAEVVQ